MTGWESIRIAVLFSHVVYMPQRHEISEVTSFTLIFS
jgi:hypothetical protein